MANKYNELTPKIRYSFLFLEGLYFATGVILIVFSVLWWMNFGENVRSGILNMRTLFGGLASGIVIVLSSLISIPGFLSPLRLKGSLKLHAFLIVMSAIGLLVLGARIWFTTLNERSHFSEMWHDIYSDRMKASFQDMLQCCGYNDVTDGAVTSRFCNANRLSDSTTTPCIDDIVTVADNLLRQLFTSLFGFLVIDMFVFFSTIILIQTITVEQRYRKIDSKYGSMTDKVLDRQYL